MDGVHYTCSRRSLLHASCATGLALVGGTVVRPTRVTAAPTVTIAVPHIDLIDQCQATISVEVTCEALVSPTRYVVFGDILEADVREEHTDFGGRLDRLVTTPDDGATQTLRLTCQAWAEDIGLMRGVGPARNETDPADDVELFARIWIRDLTSGETFGPWDSPQRAVFTNAWLTASPHPGRHPEDLLLPRPDDSSKPEGAMGSLEARRLVPLQSCLTRRP